MQILWWLHHPIAQRPEHRNNMKIALGHIMDPQKQNLALILSCIDKPCLPGRPALTASLTLRSKPENESQVTQHMPCNHPSNTHAPIHHKATDPFMHWAHCRNAENS